MTLATPPPKELLRAPKVAWPTIGLMAGTWAVWAATVTASALGWLPYAAALPVLAVAAFVSFTPLHDATHGSVARNKQLNKWVGRAASVLLIAPYSAFRYVHLAHHQNTNIHGDDPDLWSGRGPKLLLPLRWMTQDLHYYWLIAKNWKSRPQTERRAVLVESTVIFGVAGALAALGAGWALLLYWVVPARIATLTLAWSFDYAPHRPHDVASRDDRYRATHIIKGRGLTIPLLSQNYHLIHHLYPGVPFYGYGRVWRHSRETLLARGSREVPLIGHVPPSEPPP